ncbi:MAG: HD domain-containing protein [Eubacteriales bacterium]|nr:HD domain-containing protein [Eubacteriales bacterium]
MNKKLNMPLPPEVTKIIERLENYGYEAYAVGGCVRDFVCGRKIHDYDITTSATPEEIKNVFSDMRLIPTGERHGTVSVIFNDKSIKEKQIEITTYRIDGEYIDSRHPTEVIFTRKLAEDLSRRDFTVNALAYNPRVGIVDVFGGIDDIKNKIIRAVGDAKKRFEEDALRILRALRFSSVLGFDIEKTTSDALISHAHLLSHISSERIREEFSKLLLGENAVEILRKYHSVISVFIPEIKSLVGFEQHNPHHKYDVFEHTLHALNATDENLCLRFAVLLHDIGKPSCYFSDENGIGHFYGHESIGAEITDEICKRLKFDNKTRERVVSLVRYHGVTVEEKEKSVKRALLRYGEDLFFDIMAVKKADLTGTGTAFDDLAAGSATAGDASGSGDLTDTFSACFCHIDKIIGIARKILSQKPCMSLGEMNFNGNDAKEIGFSGKEIGDALTSALTAIIDGDIPNEKKEIKEYLLCRKKK